MSPWPVAPCTAEPRHLPPSRPGARGPVKEYTVATEVELPQLGESVEEGVITAWLVEVGDTVEVDQPLVEISTDKVDTEIPSPVAGTITELRASVDDTIEVGQVIAVVGDADEADAGGAAASAEEPAATAAADEDQASAGTPEPAEDTGQEQPSRPAATADDAQRPAPRAQPEQAAAPSGSPALTSPLTRKLLREAGLSPDQVEGTGPGGRITRADAERAIERGGEATGTQPEQAAEGAAAPAAGEQPSSAPTAAAPTPPPTVIQAPAERERPPASPTQVDFGGQASVTQDLSRVRKAIARSMMDSLSTTAQLTAAVEVDLTAVMNLRAAKKDAFKAQEGASLSPLPIISRAVCMVMPRHPVMNSQIDEEAGTATFHRNINLGIAVDTDRGLLVPNIKDAQDLTVPGLARRIADLAGRTRSRKIQPDEISGGTFTITNTGSVGTLFDTPILNPPEVGILATCAVEKRPVVISDAHGDSIAIRWMSYFCLTYDHRMVDGADAARFLQDLKFVLETHDFATELGV
ncbi:MAG: 2-oxoglutarate dehydrogenase, E2 component, dihydrolipoamide succinyltransferase [Nitriliruptoraceae bacterium]